MPLSIIRSVSARRMIWQGNVRPGALLGNYYVEIDYLYCQMPDVRVLAPGLERYRNEPVPHLYTGERLCLYFNNGQKREWNPFLWLADTTLPWTALWLYFYEHWLVTGEWLGDGVHPAPGGEQHG